MKIRRLVHIGWSDNGQPWFYRVGDFGLTAEDAVLARWYDDDWREGVVLQGLPNTDGLRPEDGRPFFDLIPRAFRQSTRTRIEEVDVDWESLGPDDPLLEPLEPL